MKRLAAIACFFVAVASATPAHAASDRNAYTASETYITSADGTKLHARVYRPAGIGNKKTPVILNVGPYAGSAGSFFFDITDPALLVSSGIPGPGGFAADARIFERGYSYVVVGLRGYGGSGGCYDFGGPGEQADSKAAVQWSATRAWSTGKVGMIGHSYEGLTQLMALATKAKGLAAVIPGAPPSGYRGAFTNGVRNFGSGTAFGAFYAASDLWPPSFLAPTEEMQNALSGTAVNPTCYASVTAGSYDSNPTSSYWRVRELTARAASSTVPVMLAHGFNDWNVRTSNILPEFSKFRGPHRAFLGPWDHGLPAIGKRYALERVAWLDHWLLGKPLESRNVVSVLDHKGRWRAEKEWPPIDARPWTMKLNPGTYLAAPGNNAETGLPDQFPVTLPVPLPTGRGIWTFTQPLGKTQHLAGMSTINIRLTSPIPDVDVIALVYDIDPSGNAQFVERGAYRAPGSGEFTFGLYPQDWRFDKGHRIGVLVTGADDFWFEPTGLPSQVTVAEAEIRMPLLRSQRTSFLTSGPFTARPQHPPFQVSPSTISSATRRQALP